MFGESSSPVTVEVAVKQLTDALDTLLAVDLTGASRDDLLDLARGVETHRRRLPTADHALIGELDARAVAGQLACASTPALLMQLLRLTPAEAKARVRAAEDLGPRRTLTGQLLPPSFPAVAAAQAEGAISDRHAAVIRHTVHQLPAAASHQAEQVEQALTGHALRLDPDQLARAGQRLLACLDPDGRLADERDHDRRRHGTLTGRRDGSGDLRVRLTPAALAKCHAVLDSLAAPHPAADGTPDPRTAGQRLHDAVEEMADRLLRAGELPDCGGTPATVLLTLTLADLESRLGTATTAHGGQLSVPEALRLAGEADIIPVVLNDTGGILGYGRARRVATGQQRLALAARDGGCSFPGCDRPADWTQAHHVIPWQDGGPTDLDNLTLLCGFHHREFGKRGWTCTMIDGVPHWIPPAFLDPNANPDATPPTTSNCHRSRETQLPLGSVPTTAGRRDSRCGGSDAASAIGKATDLFGPGIGTRNGLRHTDLMSRLAVGDLGTILSVWAHPDDEGYCCGGLMASAVRGGQQVVCVTATRGELGSTDPSRWPNGPELAAVRTRELAASLAVLGVTEHHWLGYPDGGCDAVDQDEAAAQLRRIVDRVQPDTVLSFGPDGATYHPDHMAVSRWATAAALGTTARVLHQVQTPAWQAELNKLIPRDVVMMADREPVTVAASACAVYLSLEGELLDLKYRAMLRQESQIGPLLSLAGPEAFRALLAEEAFTDERSAPED